MAIGPMIEVEATVLYVREDPAKDCEQRCPGYSYPQDNGTLGIDRVVSIYNPQNRSFPKIQEGDKVDVRFYFSARPAKRRFIPIGSAVASSPEFLVSHRLPMADPIQVVDGFFIYSTEDPNLNETIEIVLPGLKEGMRIRTTLGEAPHLTMFQYQIVG